MQLWKAPSNPSRRLQTPSQKDPTPRTSFCVPTTFAVNAKLGQIQSPSPLGSRAPLLGPVESPKAMPILRRIGCNALFLRRPLVAGSRRGKCSIAPRYNLVLVRHFECTAKGLLLPHVSSEVQISRIYALPSYVGGSLCS